MLLAVLSDISGPAFRRYASETTTRQSWPGEIAPKAPELVEFGAELCGAWWLFSARMCPEIGPLLRRARARRESSRARWRAARHSNPRWLFDAEVSRSVKDGLIAYVSSNSRRERK